MKASTFTSTTTIILYYLYIIVKTNSNLQSTLCEYATEDGYKYNFEKLRKTDKDYDFINARYTYRANFCGPLVNKCANGPNVPTAYVLTGLILLIHF